jgi:hypothetical protein
LHANSTGRWLAKAGLGPALLQPACNAQALRPQLAAPPVASPQIAVGSAWPQHQLSSVPLNQHQQAHISYPACPCPPEYSNAAPAAEGDPNNVGHVITTAGGSGTAKQVIRYLTERVVGNGSFGVVFQAKCIETGETVRLGLKCICHSLHAADRRACAVCVPRCVLIRVLAYELPPVSSSREYSASGSSATQPGLEQRCHVHPMP